MAISEESNRKARENMMKIDNKGDKKVYLVAQELKLARVLAGNNKTARDRALNTLKKWLTERSKTVPFTEDDFQRIWKGLFYSMWMSDKPLVQEECAENIANLIHLPILNDSLLFFKAGITILNNEWFGIDQLRLDKFLMLVRRLLRQMFVALKEHGLNKKNIENFSNTLSETILNPNAEPPVSLFMHFTEIFLEELAKVTNGNINSDRFVEIVEPFIKKLAATEDGRQIGHLRKYIFTYLIRQSNLGLEYQAKYDAWKKAGFPGSIESVQKIKLSGEESENESREDQSNESDVKEKPLDPRAGRVDVELPQIKFNPKAVAAALLQHKFDKNSNAKSRKLISVLADQFYKLANGTYPLGVKKILDNEKNVYDTSIRKAANRLIKFEKKLMGKDRKRKRNSENNETKSEVAEKRRKIENNITENENIDGNSSADNSKIENDSKPKMEAKHVKSDKNTAKIKNVKSNKKVNNSEAEIKKIKLRVKENDSSIEKNKAEDKKADDNKNVNTDNIDDNELMRFIKESKENIKKQLQDFKHNLSHNKIEKTKKKKLNNKQKINDNIECVLNSGLENKKIKLEVKENASSIEKNKVDDNKNVDTDKIDDNELMQFIKQSEENIKTQLQNVKHHLSHNKIEKTKKKKLNNAQKINDNIESILNNGKVENKKIKLEVKENASSIEKNKVDDNKNVDTDKIDDNELMQFIKQSEENIKKQLQNYKHNLSHNKIEKTKKKKLNNAQKIIDNIECVFERNSGTWVVYDVSKEKEEAEAPSLQPGSLNESVGNLSEIKKTPSKLTESSKKLLNSTSKTKKSGSKRLGSNSETLRSLTKSTNNAKSKEYALTGAAFEENASPKSGLNPVRLFESPQKKKEIFPKSEWDEPLQEGEYEICIPSKKYIGKMRAMPKKKRHSVHELINTSVKIKGKSRLSLDANLIKNPFSTPSSIKKVKINTKLNMSQEVHEHRAQIKNSPGIPYDANKKPSKPLLKTPVSSTPVNPFYNKQLSVW